MFLLLILIVTVLVLAYVYFVGRYNEYYWKKRGVKFYSKNRFLGPLWDYLTQDRALFEILYDIYKEYPNEPAVGIGSMTTPAVYIKDPMNIQHVTHIDFQAFNHRGVEFLPEDVLADNILFMHGIRWKVMRQHMSPLFTAAKLKNMYYIVDKSAKDLIEYLKDDPSRLNDDVFNTLSRFCCAAIGAAVFGISSKSVFDLPFLQMAQAAFSATPIRNLKFSIGNTSIWLSKVLKIQLFKEYESFFIGAVSQVLRQREKENVKKHDFADICLSIQKNGTMIDPETGYKIEPTDGVLAAQGFFFFSAGVDPTATAIYCTLFELGKDKEVLEKLQREVDEAFEKTNGEFDYDSILSMDYLEKVLNESLRLHPPIGFLTRLCTRDTVLPVGNIKVEKGTKIYTALYEMHYDEKYFTNPKKFDPERFDNDNKSSEYTYQPFGKGNRMCIGMRYAKLQIKAALVHLLRHYTVKSKIDGDLMYLKQTVQVRPKNARVELIPRKIKAN